MLEPRPMMNRPVRIRLTRKRAKPAITAKPPKAAINIMVRFLLQQPPVNGEPLQAFLHGLHRHTALPHVPRVVDSMEIPAFQ